MALGDRVASRSACDSWWLLPPSRLGVRGSVEARKKIVRGFGEELVRGWTLTPREITKSNWSKARGVGLQVVRPGQELELR